jgi:hypothetical protein
MFEVNWIGIPVSIFIIQARRRTKGIWLGNHHGLSREGIQIGNHVLVNIFNETGTQA